MNDVIELLLSRRSVRAYSDEPIPDDVRETILAATMRAPTAGNMMLYSIIEVERRDSKETLVRTCDNQPFIAQAPLVLLFLADYQRTYDYYLSKGVGASCEREGRAMRRPEEGDLMLACCDAVIAAHTAVIAAESLGVGSCYIGDIMENYETHRDLFDLPEYVFPICLVCFGYPRKGSESRPLTSRFPSEFIVFRDGYRRLTDEEFDEMYQKKQKVAAKIWKGPPPVPSVAELNYARKFNAGFTKEMSRSVRAMLEAWRGSDS